MLRDGNYSAVPTPLVSPQDSWLVQASWPHVQRFTSSFILNVGWSYGLYFGNGTSDPSDGPGGVRRLPWRKGYPRPRQRGHPER